MNELREIYVNHARKMGFPQILASQIEDYAVEAMRKESRLKEYPKIVKPIPTMGAYPSGITGQ